MTNIKQELEKIEIPKELHERSKLGVKKAKAENRKRNFKQPIVAAAIILGLATGTVGYAFPSVASNIPIIGDIFKFLKNESDLYDEYKEFSTEVNTMEESNGIKVTVNDAIFDGETVTMTYSIVSEHDLGESPHINGHFDVKGTEGMAGSSKIEKVAENEYVGLITGTYFSKDNLQNAEVKWEIKSFSTLDGEQEKVIKGDWNFAFNLDATESQMKLIGQSVKEEGIRLNIEKMVTTPMSFILHYEQEVSENIQDKWHHVYVELEIKDDLGNVYFGEVNGGSGKDSYIKWSKTFERLNPNATKLIVTPHVMLRNSENFTSVEETKDGIKETKLPEKYDIGQEELTLEDIIIELNQ